MLQSIPALEALAIGVACFTVASVAVLSLLSILERVVLVYRERRQVQRMVQGVPDYIRDVGFTDFLGTFYPGKLGDAGLATYARESKWRAPATLLALVPPAQVERFKRTGQVIVKGASGIWVMTLPGRRRLTFFPGGGKRWTSFCVVGTENCYDFLETLGRSNRDPYRVARSIMLWAAADDKYLLKIGVQTGHGKVD